MHRIYLATVLVLFGVTSYASETAKPTNLETATQEDVLNWLREYLKKAEQIELSDWEQKVCLSEDGLQLNGNDVSGEKLVEILSAYSDKQKILLRVHTETPAAKLISTMEIIKGHMVTISSYHEGIGKC